ncbi:MAG: hypothetical protein ABWY96_09515 [Gaiellaceae bacterium]
MSQTIVSPPCTAPGQERERYLPLGSVGGDERGRPRGPVGCAGQMERMPQNQREWLRE